MMYNKIEIKIENYSEKPIEFNNFIPLFLRSEGLSKIEQDEIKHFYEVYTLSLVKVSHGYEFQI